MVIHSDLLSKIPTIAKHLRGLVASLPYLLSVKQCFLAQKTQFTGIEDLDAWIDISNDLIINPTQRSLSTSLLAFHWALRRS